MDNSQSGSSSASGGFDLGQFHEIFFEEAAENLENMEQLLLELDLQHADDEELNAIFRCAHSIKGGAATFGFTEVASLTHHMETLLDKLRRHELQATAQMTNTLLASGDALKAQLARRQSGSGDEVDTQQLLQDIATLAQGEALSGATASPAPAPEPTPKPAPPPPPAAPAPTATLETGSGSRVLELLIGPLSNPAAATGVVELFHDIEDLGQLETLDADPARPGLHRFKVTTASSNADLLDLLSFHVSREQVQLQAWSENQTETPPPTQAAWELFDDAPSTPAAQPAAASPEPSAAAEPAPPKSAPAASPARSSSLASSSLRVPVEKVDQLINLTGELVITQTMLAQAGTELDPGLHQRLLNGLAELERNTRDLQEAVMSIRMIPMASVFSRFPRMLHDLAGRLDKKVELVTEGEATELDKGMVEKLIDPLTHLVRNSCDHGIEMPADRVAKGKPETGTITLAAAHQGGNIVIEVRDDGNGLSRQKLLDKARSKGLDAPDTLSDSEVWALIFNPGFSTVEAVTDVSGRGVGMDVVTSNIRSLGGSVEVESTEGRGMCVRVRLPLTLAIMESISVGIDTENYVLPLASVVESFQPSEDRLKTAAGMPLVRVHEEYLPVIDLQQVFQVPRTLTLQPANPVMVVVEAEGVRAALVVDEILGQQQVVVKNLEANFRRVEHVSGATIAGDGSVALILDVATLVRQARLERAAA